MMNILAHLFSINCLNYAFNEIFIIYFVTNISILLDNYFINHSVFLFFYNFLLSFQTISATLYRNAGRKER